MSELICHTCGQSYPGCPKCEGLRGEMYVWRNLVCSRECYIVYMTVHDYVYGMLPIDKAYDALSCIDIPDLSEAGSGVNNAVNEILAYKPVGTPKVEEAKNVKDAKSNENESDLKTYLVKSAEPASKVKYIKK